MLDSHDPTALEPGDVLVAPITDPSWTPLFVPAGGVVVDVGAALSHAIIVSRELGIPCVVSATDATRRIPDGALVRVDGNTGMVTVLEALTSTWSRRRSSVGAVGRGRRGSVFAVGDLAAADAVEGGERAALVRW